MRSNCLLCVDTLHSLVPGLYTEACPVDFPDFNYMAPSHVNYDSFIYDPFHPDLYWPAHEFMDDNLDGMCQPIDGIAQALGNTLDFNPLAQSYTQPSFHTPDYANIKLPQQGSLATSLDLAYDLNPSFLASPASWSLTQASEALWIPQRIWAKSRFSRSDIASTSIDFDMDNGSALNAADALRHRYGGLVLRDEAVPFEGTSIYLRFEWPGYRSWVRQIKTRDWTHSRNPITGAKLANEIAKSLNMFIEHVQDQEVNGADLQWKVGHAGSGHISVEDVAILSIRRVSKASWQADFGLIC